VPKLDETVASGTHADKVIPPRGPMKRGHRGHRSVDQLIATIERAGWKSLSKGEQHRFWNDMSDGGRYLFHPTEREWKWLHDPSVSDWEKRVIWEAIRDRKLSEVWEENQTLKARRGRHQEMRGEWLACRERGMGILAADRAVATRFGVTPDTVRRKRRELGWG
jgi:hypothetical protein